MGASLNKPIWPTPDAGLLNDREEPDTFLERQRFHANKASPTRAGLTLGIAAKIWSTPAAGDSERGADMVRRDTGKPASSLTTEVATWPTPATRDYKGTNSAEHMDVSSGSLHLDQLPNFVAHVWATPRAVEGEKGGKWQQSGSAPPTLTLTGQVDQWSTPAVADVQGGRRARSKSRSNELLLNGQADSLSSHLDQTTWTDGDTSPSSHLTLYRRYRATTCCVLRSERRALLLMAIRKRGDGARKVHQRGWTRRRRSPQTRPSFRRQLNPTFVFWLMGWKTGSMTSGLLEMGSSQWLEAWRSELSAVDYLDAPPEQLNLFG